MTKSRVFTLQGVKSPGVRIRADKDGILYCASDVAKALGFKDPHSAMMYHCRDIGKYEVQHPKSKVSSIEMCFIPEADVIRLAAARKKRDSMAIANWITNFDMESIQRLLVHGDIMRCGKSTLAEIFDCLLERVDLNSAWNRDDGVQTLEMLSDGLNIFYVDLRQLLLDCDAVWQSDKGNILPNEKKVGKNFFLVCEKVDPTTGKLEPYIVATEKAVMVLSRLLMAIWDWKG